MPSFLSIPRELRDSIYSLSTQSHWDANSALRVILPPAPDGQNYFWPENGKWQSISLLCVNRKVRQEVLDLIRNRHKNETQPLRTAINIRCRGYVYTPCWTYLNYALRPHDSLNLDINLVISSTEAFKRNDGWPRQPGQMFRSLLNLLCRFMHNGPSFLDSAPSFETRGPHFIDLLSVDISFQDHYTPATWEETAHEIFRMLKALSLLDTAGQHIGKIRASTAYTHGGEDTVREREWEVCTPQSAAFTESEWSRIGFHFVVGQLPHEMGSSFSICFPKYARLAAEINQVMETLTMVVLYRPGSPVS